MINFIIYEDEEYFANIYEDSIHKFMGNNNDRYKTYIFKKYSPNILNIIKNINGQNIFIFDIEVKGKSGLDFAREVRKLRKTMNDQIIIVTAHQDLIQNAFHNKLLMLDFISKFDDLEYRLMICFQEIYEIFNANKFLSFKQDGEIIRIPYNDILFIEKNKTEDYLEIETASDTIIYKSNIAKLEKILSDDIRFFKTHRSCIVNIFRITKLNSSIPIIYFENKSTSCWSRDKRKALEERCMVGDVYV